MRKHRPIKAVFDKIFQESKAAQVNQIHLAVGEIFEFDNETIQLEWYALSKDTPLEQAQLHLRLITAEAQCMACFKKYHPVNGIIHCPNCGSFGAKILSGEEFYVEHIETDEE